VSAQKESDSEIGQNEFLQKIARKVTFSGCSKKPRCKAPEIQRSKEISIEAYWAEYVAMTKDEGNAADGLF
jgi:hypothetical protein